MCDFNTCVGACVRACARVHGRSKVQRRFILVFPRVFARECFHGFAYVLASTCACMYRHRKMHLRARTQRQLSKYPLKRVHSARCLLLGNGLPFFVLSSLTVSLYCSTASSRALSSACLLAVAFIESSWRTDTCSREGVKAKKRGEHVRTFARADARIRRQGHSKSQIQV